MKLFMTTHAVERSMQRAGRQPNIKSAVRIPRSLIRKFSITVMTKAKLKKGVRYFATSVLVLVVIGRRVVTCIGLSVEDLAEVLVDILFRPPSYA